MQHILGPEMEQEENVAKDQEEMSDILEHGPRIMNEFYKISITRNQLKI